MSWHRTLSLLGLVACLATCLASLGAPSAAADDEDEAQPARIERTIDLRGYRVGPAPKGPRLAVPTDLIGAGRDATEDAIWSLDAEGEGGTWLAFERPDLERDAISADSIEALLQSTLPEEADLDVEHEEARLVLSGKRATVEAAMRNWPWVRLGLAASLRADAVLTVTSDGEEERLRAMGGVTLWPGRWTRVYLRESETPCAATWGVEVAQEALTMDPQPVGVPEGEECYLRYHPGETVSLVEIWAGSVEHLEIVKQDLSHVRNVPEANGLGVLSYPRSAVNRVFSHVVFATGERSEQDVRWTNEGRSMRLRLAFGQPTPKAAPLERAAARGALALVRFGAVASALGFGAREVATDAWVERISSMLYARSEAYEKRGRTFEFSLSALQGSVVLVDAPAAELPKARALVAEAESKLRTRRVGLRVLAVPERAYRAAVLAGRVHVGRPVAAELLVAWREAGAVPAEAITTSALLDVRAGFRVGHSVPGIVDLDCEIAQQSAGLYPLTSARFAGLVGDLLVRAAPGGLGVRVRGTLAWARSDAGTLVVTVRPPISMAGPKVVLPNRATPDHAVSVPILGGGEAPIDTALVVADGDTREQLVHVHVRQDEVFLVLLRLP